MKTLPVLLIALLSLSLFSGSFQERTKPNPTLYRANGSEWGLPVQRVLSLKMTELLR